MLDVVVVVILYEMKGGFDYIFDLILFILPSYCIWVIVVALTMVTLIIFNFELALHFIMRVF